MMSVEPVPDSLRPCVPQIVDCPKPGGFVLGVCIVPLNARNSESRMKAQDVEPGVPLKDVPTDGPLIATEAEEFRGSLFSLLQGDKPQNHIIIQSVQWDTLDPGDGLFLGENLIGPGIQGKHQKKETENKDTTTSKDLKGL